MTQSNGTVSHVHSWKPCMTSPYVHSAHKRWYDCASRALSLHMWFHVFIFLIHLSPPPHTFLSRCFCARACIWHLSGGLRVMPWSCHNLGHCHTYASRYEKLHLSAYHSGWAGTKQQQGFFLLACICPQKSPGCHASPCGLDVSVKTPARTMWNTTQRNSSCFRGLQ